MHVACHAGLDAAMHMHVNVHVHVRLRRMQMHMPCSATHVGLDACDGVVVKGDADEGGEGIGLPLER